MIVDKLSTSLYAGILIELGFRDRLMIKHDMNYPPSSSSTPIQLCDLCISVVNTELIAGNPLLDHALRIIWSQPHQMTMRFCMSELEYHLTHAKSLIRNNLVEKQVIKFKPYGILGFSFRTYVVQDQQAKAKVISRLQAMTAISSSAIQELQAQSSSPLHQLRTVLLAILAFKAGILHHAHTTVLDQDKYEAVSIATIALKCLSQWPFQLQQLNATNVNNEFLNALYQNAEQIDPVQGQILAAV